MFACLAYLLICSACGKRSELPSSAVQIEVGVDTFQLAQKAEGPTEKSEAQQAGEVILDYVGLAADGAGVVSGVGTAMGGVAKESIKNSAVLGVVGWVGVAEAFFTAAREAKELHDQWEDLSPCERKVKGAYVVFCGLSGAAATAAAIGTGNVTAQAFGGAASVLNIVMLAGKESLLQLCNKNPTQFEHMLEIRTRTATLEEQENQLAEREKCGKMARTLYEEQIWKLVNNVLLQFSAPLEQKGRDHMLSQAIFNYLDLYSTLKCKDDPKNWPFIKADLDKAKTDLLCKLKDELVSQEIEVESRTFKARMQIAEDALKAQGYFAIKDNCGKYNWGGKSNPDNPFDGFDFKKLCQ